MSDNEKGFLQVNNQIVDYWMAQLTSAEFKTLLAIVRKTKGWNKPYDRISQSQIAALTGLTTRSVRTAISLLEKKKLIIVAGDDNKTRLFSVNYHTVNDVETDVTAIEKAIRDAEVISKYAEVISPQKEVISKDAEADFHHNRQTIDTINKQSKDSKSKPDKKEVKFSPTKPNDVSSQTWNDLLQLRKTKRAVESQTAWTRINNAIERAQQATGHSLEDIYSYWVMRAWSGFDDKWYVNAHPKQKAITSTGNNGYERQSDYSDFTQSVQQQLMQQFEREDAQETDHYFGCRDVYPMED